MKRNIGWPKELFGDFEDFTEIDAYHEDDYASILNMDNFYVIAAALRKGYFNRQIARLITQPSDRHYFLYSPASVNAWYQQERNSITIPCGVWTYPLYRQNYPMSAKFASIGSFARELVRGLDERGIQFGSAGELVGCSWKECGWLDKASKKNFREMAQCVVTQYR
ncbi:unnamed protein product [Heligmosomoides polygyrus]|uniref:Peptidase_M13 domain-containing protein n=1 Tax=Heligmosomoides polygyrus TaxID=6339 RepID=A0A183F5I5_HELPZ|nr:unnamed protein product [Heligmosomoides polygyrus]